MSLVNDPRQQAKELLDPILAVFGGEDGGRAFAVLQHQFLPAQLETLDQRPNDSEASEQLVLVITRFSKLCQMALDGKLG